VVAAEQYGYLGVALAIGLESMGVPIPGETALVAAALPDIYQDRRELRVSVPPRR
jgi:hypothetical protein